MPSQPSQPSQLTPLAPHLWTIPAPLSLLGLQIHTRTTVAQDPHTGALWVHSPGPLTEGLAAALDALGPVSHLVAPNLFHHLYFQSWCARWPSAARWAPRGLERKRPDLSGLRALDDLAPGSPVAGWPQPLLPFPLEGIPRSKEWVFYHASSETLILTDLLFYLPRARGLTWLYAALNRCARLPAQTLLLKSLVQDKASLRRSCAPLLELSVARLSMCHHELYEGGEVSCAEVLRRATLWMDKSS